MANQYRSVLASSGPAPTGGDALPAEVLSGKTFTNDNGPQTGTMTNNGAVTQILSAGQSYTIPEGYHNGEGTVSASGKYLNAISMYVFVGSGGGGQAYSTFSAVGSGTVTFNLPSTAGHTTALYTSVNGGAESAATTGDNTINLSDGDTITFHYTLDSTGSASPVTFSYA